MVPRNTNSLSIKYSNLILLKDKFSKKFLNWYKVPSMDTTLASLLMDKPVLERFSYLHFLCNLQTYTMEGPGIQSEIDMPIVDQEKRGMIPRAVEQIFVTAESLKEKGWSYEMEAMFVEIYNETIRDLLTTKKNDDQKYEIKHDAKGNTSITNANYGNFL